MEINMQIKKIAAAGLSAAILLSAAGCNKAGGNKGKEKIEDLMESYVEALNDFYADGVLDLTNWKKKDDSSKEVRALLDHEYYVHNVGVEMTEIYECISSTIVINYESDAIDIDGDEAAVKVTYELVDWKAVFKDGHPDLDSVLDDLKSSKETFTVKGKLNFELVDKEWKISKISNLDHVFEFVNDFPDIEIPSIDHTSDTEPDPTGIDPTGTVFADSYDRAIELYIDVLKEYEDAIRTAKDVFGFNNMGIYDLDGNGIPELFFLATTDGMKISGDLYVFSYNEAKDEAMQIMYFHNVVYMAADGGGFTFYLTSDKLVLTQSGGEESLYHHDTTIYDLGWYNETTWHINSEYRREEIYDYDTDEQYEKYYKDGIEIENPDYTQVFTSLVGDTQKVLMSSFYADTDSIEYQQKYYETLALYSYDMMINYLKAIRG